MYGAKQTVFMDRTELIKYRGELDAELQGIQARMLVIKRKRDAIDVLLEEEHGINGATNNGHIQSSHTNDRPSLTESVRSVIGKTDGRFTVRDILNPLQVIFPQLTRACP